MRFEFYANLDTAYADLLSGNLDVLDTIPPSALPIYKRDLGDKRHQRPGRRQPEPRHPAAAAAFRRRGRPAAPAGACRPPINRPQICRADLHRTPASRHAISPPGRFPGFDPNLPGNDVLNFDPDRARQLWAQADAISAWSGRYAIAYNADAGHQEWVDAVANSIKNVLGIDAVGAPQPTFAGFRTQITNRTIATAFRAAMAGRLPVDDRVSRPAVRHRCGFQRRRLLQPGVRRGAGGRRGRAHPAAGRRCWPTTRSESCSTTCPSSRCGTTSAWSGGRSEVSNVTSPGTICPTTRTSSRAEHGLVHRTPDRRHGAGFHRRHAADLRHGLPAAR